MRLELTAFLTPFMFVAFAMPASAQQTLKVPSAAFPTIASAVAAANSGDTIQVASNNAPGSFGVYSEVIVVPNTKTGLHFKGSNVVWDGDVANDILTFTGPNDGVTVEGFIFRNGTSHVTITGNNATVTKCRSENSLGNPAINIVGNFAVVTGITVNGSLSTGVQITGTDAIVDKCTFTGLDTEAVLLLGGDRGVISGCKILNIVDDGVDVTGNDIQILKNTFTQIASDCIVASGDGLIVDGNKLEICGSDGINIGAGSDNAIVQNNSIKSMNATGIIVNGAHATILKNKIENVATGIVVSNGNTVALGGPTIQSNSIKTCRAGDGIRVTSDAPTILSNSITGVTGGNDGIQVDPLAVSPQGGSVANNKLQSVGSRGIAVTTDSMAISKNTIQRGGGSTSSSGGIRVLADLCTLVGNSVQDFHGDGFFISGNTNTVTDCKATNCLRDGFDISTGDANTIEDCSATGCDAEGLDNSVGVTNTSVRNSSFSKCRIDFAGNGTLLQDLNNTFTTGGAATVPVID